MRMNSQKVFVIIFSFTCIISSMVCALEPGDFSKWYYWPRTSVVSMKMKVENKARIAEFVLNEASKSAVIYSYCNLTAGRRYKLSFDYKFQCLKRGVGADAKVQIMFIGTDGKNGSAGTVKYPLELSTGNRNNWEHFSREFNMPETSKRCQVAPLALRSISGTFLLKKISVVPVTNTVKIKKTVNPPIIDGQLNDSCWGHASKLDNFYCFRGSVPSKKRTEAFLTYDGNKIYIAVRSFESKKDLLKKTVITNDGPVWQDDAVEVFIATEKGKKLQLILNSIGTRWDGELYMRVPGDPYQINPAWNGRWDGAAKTDESGWTAEFSIPFDSLNEYPAADKEWRLNIVRENQVGEKEISQWNRHGGALNNVAKFAVLKFYKDSAVLTRYSESVMKAPLEVKRPQPLFRSIAGKTSGNYTVMGMSGAFLLTFYSPQYRSEHAAKWADEQAQMMRAMHQAGMQGPIGFPWAIKILGGENKVKELAAKYNFTFPLALHNSSHDRAAIRNGARYYYGKTVNVADPKLEEAVLDWLKSFLHTNSWIKKYVAFARGNDEPTNNLFNVFSLRKNHHQEKELKKLDDEIKSGFGYDKFGLFDNFAENNDAYAPFRRIAFMRWWNDRFARSKASEQAEVKRLLPDVPYMPLVINATRSNRGIVSISQVAKYADWMGIDPYPTSCMAAYSRERALYHTGFSTKHLKDLSPRCRTYLYAQGFKYCGTAPNPENIREWASQGLKNGCEIINWYADANREDCPDAYNEILRVSKIITAMRPLKLPGHTKTAILYSDINTWGNFDSAMHSYYCLYSILGEKLKCWFEFVSDTQLDNKTANLGKYRLLFIPALTFATRNTCREVIKFVKSGGTAVVFDPGAMSFAPDGTSLLKQRQELIGCRLLGKVKFNRLIVCNRNNEKLPGGSDLPLTRLMNCRNAGSIEAFKVKIPCDAEIIAQYPDGSPAAYCKKLGKGKVFYFAAQPFGNSSLAIEPAGWQNFFSKLLRTVDEPMNLKIWNFKIPAKI